MFLLISIVSFQLMTLKAQGVDETYTDDPESYERKWQSLINNTGDWSKELKLMLERFSHLPKNENNEVFGKASRSDNTVAQFLMPVFVIPTQSMAIGSIVNERAILISCSSTAFTIRDGTILYVKAQHILMILTISTKEKKETPMVIGVREVRRHPTCEQPYQRGSWKNDVAILLLPVKVEFKPRILEPIKLPSYDFYEIYSAIKKKVWSNTTCYAVFMKYQGETAPWVQTYLPVKIQKYSGCPRRCGYMIDQCKQELGGYSIIRISNMTHDDIQDAALGAAIMCDGLIYGVLNPDYSCGFDSFGQLPKPEAMLYMYINFADPKIKPKAVVGQEGSPRSGSNVNVNSLMLSWVIALSVKLSHNVWLTNRTLMM